MKAKVVAKKPKQGGGKVSRGRMAKAMVLRGSKEGTLCGLRRQTCAK